ncbi:Zinc finger, C3HC4 type (RING finger) [Geosmithia morbida]|uniref:Zinc finger, C3HC4 type (RING finger) n=1 Tax=Geosmithia morbida TaxID=1094350 RepID=A0A9P4Z077_9HYPO|nr:Zinc finger, C3HC4 type (RING finger) [Geosmithia morbida]KAF4125021.1 Zinc finger, C3HC4 type (RING finger) [Geosmithia morbida]
MLSTRSGLVPVPSRSQVAYEERISQNITTLTTTNANTLDGILQGLLYVPDISSNPSCDSLQYDYIPHNVTRRADLPPTNYKLVALAPWFSIDCTEAYLASARFDPIQGLIFYKPNNSTDKPQDVDSPVWNLDDDGAWKKSNLYPVFAVPGLQGQKMMSELSLYSGNVSSIPHGDEIAELYGPNPSDYVRIWTELEMESPSNALALWIFFIIVIGSLVFIILGVSLTMHLIQRNRRRALRRRVESGEVDLEASGIKRVTVPASHVKEFPIFTYNAEPELSSASGAGSTVPSTPSSVAGSRSVRSSRSRSSRRRHSQQHQHHQHHQHHHHHHNDSRSVISDIRPPGSIRSKRSSLVGSVDTTATNAQPSCHICLGPFEHRVSVIRELSCGHIFHPECIDEFLTSNSSLCPMCKHCMLPRGYSPKITNGMVRRERALRKLRGRVDLENLTSPNGHHPYYQAGRGAPPWWRRLFLFLGSPSSSSSSSQNQHQHQHQHQRQQRSSSSENRTTPESQVPMTPLKPRDDSRGSDESAAGLAEEGVEPASITTAPEPDHQHRNTTNDTIAEEDCSGGEGEADGHRQQQQQQQQQRVPQPPQPAHRPRKKRKPRALRMLPTQPEDSELDTSAAAEQQQQYSQDRPPRRPRPRPAAAAAAAAASAVLGGRISPSSFARERMRAIAAKNAPFDDPDDQRPKSWGA